MSPDLDEVLTLLGYFLLTLLAFLIFCLWDRFSSRKIGFYGCLYFSVFWPVAILVVPIWCLLSLLETAYEKVVRQK